MAAMGPFYAYKETRLNLDPATQGSTIAINLPPHGASTWTSKQARKRSSTAEIPVAEDEGQFRQRYLATAASIYHRKHHRSPRSFLWRVLEDGKVLSIRPVDLSRQTNAADPNLTLHLRFKDAIKPGCVTFSDSPEHDVLSAFVLTESKHLYTLSLRPDFFRKASSTEDNVGNWCKSYISPGVNYSAAHRMVALSADELLFSRNDGSILNLTRISGGDGKS
jgi:nuclear pore complex protein Nup160